MTVPFSLTRITGARLPYPDGGVGDGDGHGLVFGDGGVGYGVGYGHGSGHGGGHGSGHGCGFGFDDGYGCGFGNGDGT